MGSKIQQASTLSGHRTNSLLASFTVNCDTVMYEQLSRREAGEQELRVAAAMR